MAITYMVRPSLLKILKGLAFACGGLVAVLVLAAVVAALLFDSETVKGEAAQLMMAKKQRLLRIDGDLSLSFWPGVGLRVAKASLSEPGSEQTFAAVDNVRLSLKLLPLLHKELVVDTVELEGLSARLVRYKDGRFNFDDLISADKDKPPLRFDVAGVRLSNGSVSWIDEAASRTVGLSGLALDSGRLANAAEGKLTLAGKLVVDKPAVAGSLRAVGHYRFDTDRKFFALDGLDIRSTGDMAGLTGAEAVLGADILSFTTSGLEATKLELGINSKSGEDGVELKLSVPLAKLAGERGRAEAATLAATLRGARQRTAASLNFAGLELDGRHMKATKLAFSADARQGEDGWLARLASPFEADLGAASVSLGQLGGELEISHSALNRKRLVMPLTGSLQADWARPSLTAAVNARLEDSKMGLRLDFSRFSPLALGFSLDIDRLDADKYLPKAKKEPAAREPSGKSFAFPDGMDAKGTLKIGSLQLAGVKADNLRLDVSVKNGKLELVPLAAGLVPGAQAAVGNLSAKIQQAKALPAEAHKQVGEAIQGLLSR